MKNLKTFESYIIDKYKERGENSEKEREIHGEIQKLQNKIYILQKKESEYVRKNDKSNFFLNEEYFKLKNILPFEDNGRFLIFTFDKLCTIENKSYQDLRIKKNNTKRLSNFSLGISSNKRSDTHDPSTVVTDFKVQKQYKILDWIHVNYPEYFQANKLGLL